MELKKQMELINDDLKFEDLKFEDYKIFLFNRSHTRNEMNRVLTTDHNIGSH